MPSAFPPPDEPPRLAGNSSEQVFAFLLATVEYRRKKGVLDNTIYTSFVEPETQQAVISQLKARNLACKVQHRGSGLDWYLSPGSSVISEYLSASANTESSNLESANSASANSASFAPDTRMRYDDLVAVCGLVGPVVGIIYGAFHGDIIHGFVVGFAVGMLPLLPMLILLPFMLIWEKFFEKE